MIQCDWLCDVPEGATVVSSWDGRSWLVLGVVLVGVWFVRKTIRRFDMDCVDTSQYYVVRKGEYDDMKAEIERLRDENERLSESLGNAMRLLAVRNKARQTER